MSSFKALLLQDRRHLGISVSIQTFKNAGVLWKFGGCHKPSCPNVSFLWPLELSHNPSSTPLPAANCRILPVARLRNLRDILDRSALRPLGQHLLRAVPRKYMQDPTVFHHPIPRSPTLRKRPRKPTSFHSGCPQSTLSTTTQKMPLSFRVKIPHKNLHGSNF